ncbi:MAG: hypothetical protein HY841_13825 [Bacteroidetes bacterium]|nr:hypothetical protein [Bacteroidota bacterium]
MIFKFIDRLNIGVNNLDLEALEYSTTPYSILLYQHKGDFTATAQCFQNSNQTEVQNKFKAFFKLAKDNDVSVAMTPEYSCPWSVLSELISTPTLHPASRKLFAIGCESINKDLLRSFKSTHTSDEVVIYFDETLLTANGNFFDPLCYLFKCDNKLFVLIQFKTEHMGVWTNDLEKNNYIKGNEIYVLRNNENSIYLFSLICSEAMNFSTHVNIDSLLENKWRDNPYIILNPQLNPKPNSPEFKRFREKILDYSLKDLICLNWAKGTTLALSPLIAKFSRSGIHIKTHHIDFNSDAKFINNHAKGLYYLNNKNEKHSLYLSSKELIYLIQCQKPILSGLPNAQLRKTEPEVRKLFGWNNLDIIPIESVNDGFTELLNRQSCTSAYLRDSNVCFVDKERLINLCNGKIDSIGSKWHLIINLYSFEEDENWIIKRATFIEDEEGESERLNQLKAIEYLNTHLINRGDDFPPILNTFKGKLIDEVKFEATPTYLHNLICGIDKATVAYIGEKSEGYANKALSDIKNIFQDPSLSRIVVWRKTSMTENTFSCVSSHYPSISDTSAYSTNSINKEG